jgi:hypothetical protein
MSSIPQILQTQEKPPISLAGKASFVFWLLMILFVLSPWIMKQVDPHDYEPTIGYSSEAQSVRNTSAIARLFGELRTSMSDLLFIKTERYMHGGVAYQKTFEEESTAEGPIQTVIRQPEEDWRGFIGTLERTVKPWMDPKKHMEHNSTTDLLPWYRLMTLMNPHRIRGYRVGAFILITSGYPDALQQAKEFIAEGIRNNPQNHELPFMMVRLAQHELLVLEQKHPPDEASRKTQLLEEALRSARRGTELAVASRPPDGWKGKGRPAEMEDSFLGCMHYEIFCLRRLERNDEARQRAEELLQKYGPDQILQNELDELKTE